MALFAISVLSASTPSWALLGLGDVSFDGSLEVSGNSANNEASFSPANDHRGGTATRTRLGMSSKVTEDVNGRVELTRTPRQYGTGATTVAGEEALWTVQNAYIDLNNLWGHDIRLGRQYVGAKNDLVWYIGPNSDDSLSINSIDGISAQCNKSEPKGNFLDKVHVTLFTGKVNEDDGIANTDAGDVTGDVNLSNIQVNLDVIPNGSLHVAYLRGQDSNAAAVSDNNTLGIYRIGVNGGAMENMFTYRLEYLTNTGEFKGQGQTAADALSYGGNAIDIGLGLNSPETSIGTFSGWLNWVMASGDDNTVDSDDDSFHDFTSMGINTSDRYYGEIFGKSNTLAGGSPLGQGVDTGVEGQGLEVLNIGVNFKPKFSPKCWAKLDFYTFKRSEDSVVTVANTPAATVGDKFGTEFDLTLGHNHTDNVGIEFGYAMLNVDDALTGVGAINDDAVTKLFARTNIKWGGNAE